jgi:serpin B
MKRGNLIGVIALCGILLIAAFAGIYYYAPETETDTMGEKPVATDTLATEQSVMTLVEAINEFSFNLYDKLIEDQSGNIFFSPYSIFVALAMTYEGGRGETAEEMYEILNFQQNDEVNLCSFGKIYNLLNQVKEYTLSTANALWIKENYPFSEEYLNFIENYYMGKATEMDYSDPVAAAKIINEWVENNTNGKIKDLIQSSDIDPIVTAMILTNAIYFKGIWEHEFDPDNTQDMDFEISPGNNISVPMMSISDKTFNYTETDEVQVLELNYDGDDVSMILVLPKENNISIAEQAINPTTLADWRESFGKIEVDVSIPKFKLETKYDLKKYLQKMGMNISFTQYADFSGITGYKDLFIKKVAHKAYIEVNEEGTEAAAATSVIMQLTAVIDTVTFNADHPFVFLIQHKDTGNILFMGKIVDPTK